MNGTRVVVALVLMFATVAGVVSAETTADAKLIRMLTGRSEIVRLRTVNELREDPRRRIAVLDQLIETAKLLAAQAEQEEVVRVSTIELLYLIGTIERPESEDLLVELLDSPHVGISMLSADVLGKNKFRGSIEFLKRQVNRPEYATQYGFRFNLVRALAQMAHPDAVDFLTELRSRLDGQLRYEIDKLLEEVTVNDFLGDQQRFEQWKQAGLQSQPQPQLQSPPPSEKKIVFQPAAYESESMQRIQFERPQYYGIDIHAKRMMFIIDHSGSMKEYWGGLSRLDRAKNELVRAIKQLPPDAEFSILFYETTVREWRTELVAANEENKQDAIAFVSRLGYGDRTNTYGALRRSLQFDDDLEAVFLLTDGRPTVGEIIAPQLIVNDILQRNRFRHLNFNTIGIAVTGATEQFLRTLAEQSAGEFRSAE